MTFVRIGLSIICLFIGISNAHARRTRSIESFEASNIPYQVSIRNVLGDHLCGGAIIDARYILTAAYCMIDSNGMLCTHEREVVVGTTDKFDVTEDNVFRIVKTEIPKDFSANLFFRSDIAVLKLDRNITFTPYIKQVKLPRSKTRAGTIGIISGWGATQWSKVHGKADAYPRYLRYFHQKILSPKRCQRMMPFVTIYPVHLCAWGGGNSTTCKGDSGGPLVVGEYVVGINSWNEYCNPAYPDVYTRVYRYVDWIKKVMVD